MAATSGSIEPEDERTANESSNNSDSSLRARLSSWGWNILSEIGLLTLATSGRDVHVLIFARSIRIAAYASSTLILAVYLSALGHTPTKIGLFMTLTLVGDTFLSLILTLYADSLGRRLTLALGAILMTASGIVFATTGNYWILLAAAVFGVISPSGNEIGPFRAVEESTLAHLTIPEKRGDIFAWYSLLGFGGAAVGMVTCGWVVDAVQSQWGWDEVAAYRVAFWAYALCGIVKFVMTCGLSTDVEVERKNEFGEEDPLLSDNNTASANGEVAGGSMGEVRKKNVWWTMLPNVSRESLDILVKLCILFAMDSFASGMAPL